MVNGEVSSDGVVIIVFEYSEVVGDTVIFCNITTWNRGVFYSVSGVIGSDHSVAEACDD